MENKEEQAYLDLVKTIIENGHKKEDRTGTGTLSLFGQHLRFNLQHGFPLLTTKRVFFKAVAEELLWFISGDTSSKTLDKKGVHIWDKNGSRTYLDSIGLNHREEGDLGPVYGFQWRHFGAKYIDCHTDYSYQGIDQLQHVIDTIVKNPNDRRIILCAWNPIDLPSMALPACHVLSQFYVSDGTLSCHVYQRSCDMGLGIPFNIASYALLTCMISKLCYLIPGELIFSMGDTHVYTNHVNPLKIQIDRKPRSFPKLTINRKETINDDKIDDFVITDYFPYEKIDMEMAI